jgi:hypothetical protein
MCGDRRTLPLPLALSYQSCCNDSIQYYWVHYEVLTHKVLICTAPMLLLLHVAVRWSISYDKRKLKREAQLAADDMETWREQMLAMVAAEVESEVAAGDSDSE